MNTAPAKSAQGIGAYIAVTASYWAFMLTDGALRMLVLLHFHHIGFSPVQLAYLFVLYEIAGVVTNLSAGWIAARFGLTSTLFAGLALQICALLALARLDPEWALSASVIYVMCVQGLSGVAKDLAKMSSKSAVKLLAPPGAGGLFRWVALLTGSKNAVKGVGFLLGALLLIYAGFTAAVLGMAAVLAVIFAAVVIGMPRGLPQGRKGAKFTEVFSKNPQVNWLSAAFRSISTLCCPTERRLATARRFSPSAALWRCGPFYTARCRDLRPSCCARRRAAMRRCAMRRPHGQGAWP